MDGTKPIPCDRCGKNFTKETVDGCERVPPDRQQRFHVHHHRFDHKGTKNCLICGAEDTRIIFGLK